MSRLGAEPSLPTREECERLLGWKQAGGECKQGDAIAEDAVHSAAHMTSQQSQQRGADTEFPILFASRLNSMREQLDLWSGPDDVFGWVARQGTVRGLGLVDFNYPQVRGLCQVEEGWNFTHLLTRVLIGMTPAYRY